MSDPRVVLITGGGRGIGAATAKRMAADGDKVVITARTESQLEETAAVIRRAGGEVLVLSGDAADEERVAQVVEETVSHFGRLDVLVNNAALSETGDVVTCSPERFQEVLKINLTGYFCFAHYSTPHMIRSGGGVIINVSSLMAELSAGVSAAYEASKGGIDSLTFDLAVRLGPENIRVVGVRLGAIDTGITANWAGGDENQRRLEDYFVDLCPLGRQGTPEEAAAVLRFLASPDASYIHGTMITVDGGRSAAFYPKSLTQRIPR